MRLCLDKCILLCFVYVSATVENTEKCDRVLLHVENDGSVCSTEKSEGGGGREQTEASLHTKLQQKSSVDHYPFHGHNRTFGQ